VEGHGTDMVMKVWRVKAGWAGGLLRGGRGGAGGLIAATQMERQMERQMPQHPKIAAGLLPPKMAAVVRMRWRTLNNPAIRKTRHKYRKMRHNF
jgi:hypothetical protein